MKELNLWWGGQSPLHDSVCYRVLKLTRLIFVRISAYALHVTTWNTRNRWKTRRVSVVRSLCIPRTSFCGTTGSIYAVVDADGVADSDANARRGFFSRERGRHAVGVARKTMETNRRSRPSEQWRFTFFKTTVGISVDRSRNAFCARHRWRARVPIHAKHDRVLVATYTRRGHGRVHVVTCIIILYYTVTFWPRAREKRKRT